MWMLQTLVYLIFKKILILFLISNAKSESMKKIAFIFIALLLTINAFSQEEKYKTGFEQFKNDYNSGAFQNIFDLFSEDMQKALPLEKSNQFFGGIQTQAGKITSYEFQKMPAENTASYKTTFEKAVFEIQISIDANQKISGFLVKPFTEVSKSTLVNNLSSFPKNIAAVIFENTKDFPENTQLSIAVIRNGKATYYGTQIANGKLIPVQNKDKIFEIGSLSKVFTASVLAQLVTEGKVKLDDKINPLYPFLFKNKTAISYESLANHTAGLPRLPNNINLSNAENPYKSYGARALDDYLANQLILAKAENNTYEYSNFGAGLLGHSLGLSQRKSFEVLLSETIFKPYKMSRTYTSSKNIENQMVKGLNEEGKVVSNWDFDVLLGAGGILSTVSDLVLFANAQFDGKNKALQLTQRQTAIVNENMKIGLGWHLLKSKKGNDLLWHNGATGGYSSSMIVDVKNKNGVIILSNVSGLSPLTTKIDQLGFGLLQIIE